MVDAGLAPNTGVLTDEVAPNAGLIAVPNAGERALEVALNADSLVEVAPNLGALVAKVAPKVEEADPNVLVAVVAPNTAEGVLDVLNAGVFTFVPDPPKLKLWLLAVVTAEVLSALNVKMPLVDLVVGIVVVLVFVAVSLGLNVNIPVAGIVVDDWGREDGVDDLVNTNAPGADVVEVAAVGSVTAAVPKDKLAEVVEAVVKLCAEVEVKENNDEEVAGGTEVFGVLNGDAADWLPDFCVAAEVGVTCGLMRLKENPPDLETSLLGDENIEGPAFVWVVAVVIAEVWGLVALVPNAKLEVVVVAGVVEVDPATVKVPKLNPEVAVEGMDDDDDDDGTDAN